jgi:hypothetical protein
MADYRDRNRDVCVFQKGDLRVIRNNDSYWVQDTWSGSADWNDCSLPVIQLETAMIILNAYTNDGSYDANDGNDES